MKKTLISGIVIMLCLPVMAGGGWTSKKGEGYFKLGQSAVTSDELYNADGDLTGITTTSVYISSLYGEYGITDRLEGMVQLPLFVRMTINEVRYRSGRPGIPGDEYNYPGDPGIGLKYGIIQNKPFVLSAGFRLDFAVGKTNGGDSELLQTGDGEFNQLLMLESGYSFKGNKLYMTAGAGFNNRTKDFSDEFQYYYEVGFQPTSAITVIGKLRGTESFFNGDASDNANGIFSNNLEQIVVSPQLAYTFKNKMGISVGVWYPLQGKNILSSPIYEGGIYYLLRK